MTGLYNVKQTPMRPFFAARKHPEHNNFRPSHHLLVQQVTLGPASM
jgi:hypothetical protein